MAREDYKVTIASSTEGMTARERIMLKDMTNAVSLNGIVEVDAPLVLSIAKYARLEVHNEHARDNKDYTVHVVIDTQGTKYYTSSNSFASSLIEIMEEMGDEQYEVEVRKIPSKNYKDKFIITCSLI